jgi:hypothetical protein
MSTPYPEAVEKLRKATDKPIVLPPELQEEQKLLEEAKKKAEEEAKQAKS